MTSMMSSDKGCGRGSARNSPENVQGSAFRKATSHSPGWCLLPNTVVFLPEALTIHLDLKYNPPFLGMGCGGLTKYSRLLVKRGAVGPP